MSYGQSLAVVYFSMDIKALRAIGKIKRWVVVLITFGNHDLKIGW